MNVELLVPIFNPNPYRRIKLLEYAFKLYEKVLDVRLREVAGIAKM